MRIPKPRQKWIDPDFEHACRNFQKYLQEIENKKKGKKAQTISFAFATRVIYHKYLKGRKYGGEENENFFWD